LQDDSDSSERWTFEIYPEAPNLDFTGFHYDSKRQCGFFVCRSE